MDVAKSLGKLDTGSVTYLYTILAGVSASGTRQVHSGRLHAENEVGLLGGPRMDKVFDMVSQLPDHVQIVPCEMLTKLAKQREAHLAANLKQ